MQVTFIKPTLGRLGDDTRFVDEARMEPLSLGVLAGLTPAGVDVRLFDDRIDEIDYDEPTDLVAINVETFTARRAYEIAAEYRARGVPVVMGGMHATLVPDEVAEYADCVYTGDGESLWAQVVTDAHEGRLRPRYDAINGPPQPGALPRRDLYEGKGYLPVSLLQFGRGCHNRCEFCAVGAYFDHCHFTRPVDEVVAEIQAQSLKDLFFVDDNLVADPEAAKRLLRALAPLDVRWVSQASVEHTRDPELMQLMVDSGCLGNVIGFESLDTENLHQMHKGPNLAAFDRYAECGVRATGPSPPDMGGVRARLRSRHVGVDTGDVRLGHREPLHLRGFQRADALSVDAALRPAEGRGATALRRALVAAPRLPIQLRGVPAFSDDRRRAHRGSMDLSAEMEQHHLDTAALARTAHQSRLGLPVRALLRVQPAVPPRGVQEAGHAPGGPVSGGAGFDMRLATAEDEPDIRALVGSIAMPGAVAVRFAREPDYFLGTTIMGDPCDVLIARDRSGDRLAGIACRAERPAFVNGRETRVGYVGQIRIAPEYRGHWLVQRGAKRVREMSPAGLVYFGVIARENPRARALLVGERPPGGLRIARMSGLTTRAILLRPRRIPRVPGVEVGPGSSGTLAEIVAYLRRYGATRQLYPAYSVEDLTGGTTLRGLAAEDIMVARRGRAIAGVMAVWDQAAYKQDVVDSYGPALRRSRPGYDLAARALGAQPLTRPGDTIPLAFAACTCVADDDADVMRALIAACAHRAYERGKAFLMLGLADDDPLLPVASRLLHVTYRSDLYAFSWTVDPATVLDGRVPYIEIATL